MKLTSDAFENNSIIPKQYGYNHGNISPPLTIQDVPDETKSLVLIMDDPDAIKAVGKVWVHWILWNIPPQTKIIKENSLPKKSNQGVNDFGEVGYGGPAPPDGEHCYVFRLYALNKIISLKDGSSIKELKREISSNIIEQCIIIGKYAPQ